MSAYKIGGVTWREAIGGQRIGRIHGEAFNLEPKGKGFRWRLTRRGTGETWIGASILALARQAWVDLHGETFDVEEPELPEDLTACADCRPDGGSLGAAR